jgi:DNA-directed RNA polymerase subunit M/transcription elongation factor TFIIS
MALREQSRSLDGDDRLSCPKCGNGMILSHRWPHPRHGDVFEVQLFSCQWCSHQLRRVPDKVSDAYH